MLNKIISITFILSFLFGCSDLNDIRSPSKSIKEVNEYVFVEGRWKILTGATIVGGRVVGGIPAINYTSITCDRKHRTCDEIISLVQNPKDNKLFNQPLLYSLTVECHDIVDRFRCQDIVDKVL